MRSGNSTAKSLLARLRADYPQFTFQSACVAHWSPAEQTVYFCSTRGRGATTLLHELGHALMNHRDYHQDIQLLQCEREAWQAACTIAPHYDIEITEAMVNDALTTYRTWLHNRSRCPRCRTGAPQESATLAYRCPLCDLSWQANDARQCGLRRYRLPSPLT